MNAVTEQPLDQHQIGLYDKFEIRRTDGSSDPGGRHHGDDFFVLNLTTDKHAIPAIKAYAKSCAADYPQLAADLRAKLRARLPSEFVTIKETELPNGHVEPEFKVARYMSTVVNGHAEILADEVPTVEISFYDANAAAEAAGMKVITETQHAVLRHLLYNEGRNWTSGVVGEGSLRQGLRNDSVDEAVANDYVPDDQDEDRRFYLPDGEVLFDMAGHLCTWVRDNIQGDEKGIVAKPFAVDSLTIALPHASGTKGIGYCSAAAGRDWSGGALLRGGCWGSGGDAGLFRLGGWYPRGGDGGVGFRCTL